MKALNYYERLGVTRNATPEEIKSQYRKLAQIFHPDKTNGDKVAEESFKLINEAYECLSDKDKRLEYDQKTFAAVKPGVRRASPPSNANSRTNAFWQNAAAFAGIVFVLDALLSDQPKPRKRYIKRKKTVAKSRRRTPKKNTKNPRYGRRYPR